MLTINGQTRLFQLAGAAAGVGLVIYSSYGLWQRYAATHRIRPLPTQTITYTTAKPDETPIKPSSNYQVPADQPRRITLPTIHAEGFIQKVGLDQAHAIAAPTNVHLAGWYVDTAKPGDAGVSLIDGHVQGYYQPGIFKDLAKLRIGDQFSIEFGDHAKRIFVVKSVKSQSVNDASQYLLAQQKDIGQQLNLITCGGHYNATKRQYDQRILVVSQRVGQGA